jgi:RimJ/RimL family protein N-acetyltransferase/glycosyltransferase involved in cell wall biosynthesis
MSRVFLRLLTEGDAAFSYKWRNDPNIWQHTGHKPDKDITYAFELEWINKVLKNENEKRFAICIQPTGQYIGNVQLTGINGYDAAFHIFIGEKEVWGQGYGFEATQLMLEYGFEVLKLQSIYLDVKKDHSVAIKIYQKTGFSDLFEYDEYLRMAIFKTDMILKKVSVFVMTYNHEKYIAEALESILNQKVDFDFDIVLGDDFSKDRTRAIVVNYALQNPGKFKLLYYPKNISAAVNQKWVFKNCRGKYTAMCEGDDYWIDENKLHKQVGFLDLASDFSICFHNARILKEGHHESVEFSNTLSQKEVSTFEDLALGEYIYTATCMFKRSNLDKFPIEHYEYMNNYTLDLHNAQFGKIKYINEVMSVYRIHPGGVWSMVERDQTLVNHLPAYRFYVNYFHKKHRLYFIAHLKSMTRELLEIRMAKRNYENVWKHFKEYARYNLENSHEIKKAFYILIKICGNKLFK